MTVISLNDWKNRKTLTQIDRIRASLTKINAMVADAKALNDTEKDSK